MTHLLPRSHDYPARPGKARCRRPIGVEEPVRPREAARVSKREEVIARAGASLKARHYEATAADASDHEWVQIGIDHKRLLDVPHVVHLVAIERRKTRDPSVVGVVGNHPSADERLKVGVAGILDQITHAHIRPTGELQGERLDVSTGCVLVGRVVEQRPRRSAHGERSIGRRARRPERSGATEIETEAAEVLAEEGVVIILVHANPRDSDVLCFADSTDSAADCVFREVGQRFIEPHILERLLDRAPDTVRSIDHVLELVSDGPAGSLADRRRAAHVVERAGGIGRKNVEQLGHVALWASIGPG